ncbi:MAG: M13 family metallopeptidase [Gemmatimonadaceae bacterium]|nr:M13 family metallopeptidase [Gemmatimonadaceae bacterium]NUQ93207.1 M13 family metallopeptidase [Gemmatimonadaceae bacterium]NUR18969.1 M13 family metallopeptidase [Gemmatimonadaceae bacterium]NUS96211.1 M13 family metallopeptidase [Gemmatimonadaceae bacterium]
MIRRLVCSALLALAPAAPLAAQHAIPGLDAAAIDTTVKAGDDFYRYANGGWERRTEIPNDRSSFGSFNIAAKLADAHVKQIVHGAAASPGAAGSDVRRIADYYRSFLDTAAIAARGTASIQPLLDSIAAVGDRAALARFVGAHLRADVDPINLGTLHTDNPFGFWVTQDFNRPTHYSAALLQGGLEMPDRSYYLDPSPRMADVRTAYRSHVAKMLTLAGVANAEEKADSIVALETKIAGTHWKVEDSEDPAKGNNHWARADFAKNAPGFAWGAFFTAAGLADQDSILAWQPSAITGIAGLLGSESLASWKALLAYHAIEDRASVLPAAFDRESFAFFGNTLSGAPEQAERDARAVDATSDALGFAVGRQYVQRYFPASAKANAQHMVAGIVAAFQQRIDALDWMAPSTKAEAKAKLRTLRVSIGYPDRWPSYAALRIAPRDAYGNADRVERFNFLKTRAKLHQPVDKGEWVMTPQMVNAVNLPAMNVLNFPAAILQPPFFDATRADAMNYGGIGAVIGHEVSHSFDNLGANFDSKGRLRNWWTEADFAHFQAATQALARQYDAYHPLADASINGQQTLSEDIADLAGVTAAYDAWKASLRGNPAKSVGGLSGDEQFFLSFAQIWRTKFREPALRRQLLTNAHAPGPWRALTVRNLDAWYPVFGVAAGDTLYLAPGDRVRIW